MKRNTSKNWSNAIILLLVILNLVLASLLLFRPLPPRHKPNPKQMVKRLKHDLNLTDEQAAQFEKFFGEHVDKMERNGDQIRDLRRNLPETIKMSPSDREAHLDRIAALERVQLEQITNHYLDLKEVFTETQFEKFMELHKNRPGPRGPGRRPGR